MTREQRRVYRAPPQYNAGELNRIFSEMTDRLDQMEGYRGNPRILDILDMDDNQIKQLAPGVEDADGVRIDQRTSLGGVQVTLVSLGIYKLSTNETLQGTATAWDDAQINLGALRTVGAGVPAEVQVNSGPFRALDFSYQSVSGNEKRAQAQTQLTHGVKKGTEIRFHIHFCVDSAPAGDEVARFEITYGTLNAPGDIAPTGTTVYKNVPIPAGTLANQYFIESLVDIVDTDIGESSMFAVVVRRNSSDAADTYTGGSILILAEDGHVEKIKAGTEEEYPT
jgi:hypothetical protein